MTAVVAAAAAAAGRVVVVVVVSAAVVVVVVVVGVSVRLVDAIDKPQYSADDGRLTAFVVNEKPPPSFPFI